MPDILLIYYKWGSLFPAAAAGKAEVRHVTLLIQLQPWNVKLSAIAAGKYDAYLRAYASAARSLGHPVILSFAHEMNGTWYNWGAGHVKPAVFVAAWRHVVSVFRGEGATNVTWLWTINSTNAAGSPLSQWWPGASYVNWVGIDGYYYRPTDTFTSVFGETISQVRTFSSAPILISETAVGPIAGPGKIAGLFAGIHADRLVGLVWFDMAQDKPPYHQNWRLEDNPAMLAAFRAAMKSSR